MEMDLSYMVQMLDCARGKQGGKGQQHIVERKEKDGEDMRVRQPGGVAHLKEKSKWKISTY